MTTVGNTIRVSGFSLTDSADYAKDLLELIAGTGTIFALKLRHPENISESSTAYAIVQFHDVQHASRVKDAAGRNVLRIGDYHLKVQPTKKKHDIIPRPRIPFFTLKDATLRLGCLLEERVLSVLWSAKKVLVEFGSAMKTIYFYLFDKSVKYKLQLSYESIRAIELYSPPVNRSQTKFLLIQVWAVPKIYKLIPHTYGDVHRDPFFNYFKYDPDDQWTRTTDFTPSASIGQSYILCLEVPHQCRLPNIHDYFVHFKEHNCDFYCEKGDSYSYDTKIVPVIKSNRYTDIPYEVLFKINSMVQNGILSGPTLDDRFFRLVNPNPTRRPIDDIKHALEMMSYLKRTCLDPTRWLLDQYSKMQRSRYASTSPFISLDDGLVYIYRVQVTPAKVYFIGPEINISNRVLRHFSNDLDNFLRISFVDDDCGKLHGTDLSTHFSGNNERRTALYRRVLYFLRKGISIGSKHFEFLAFSSSQLRDHSAWMFASREGLTACDIRNWMGDFRSIRNVAKYGARLGQSFSSSTKALKVKKFEVEEIPDITNGTKHVFSDGIGKISIDCANKVARRCNLMPTPSVFQIRYGGYKGVVAIDPGSHRKLSLRKSMSKFESENTTLDVLGYSKYQPCFLNRQLITLLSTLGVKDNIFERKQEKEVILLNEMLTDPHAATKAIEFMPMGEITNAVKELLCGYLPNREPYLSMLLQTFRASKLQELKTRSRIFIQKGRAMMGCLDETRTLNYGEVFIQISAWANDHDHRKVIVKEKVVVAKNPCLHPGDVRVLQAIDVPALHHMVNCVVFPQKGPRPHPNECSGSDLDGDTYFVCWDQSLIPPRTVEPMDYTPPPTETLDHDVTIKEVQEYFTNYIINDKLGIISNAHVVFADKVSLKAESEPCIALAKLSSIAVDFPKTGVPAQIPHELYANEYPDFMEKLDKAMYFSDQVIGKLYREAKDQDHIIDIFTKDVAKQFYDTNLIVDGFEVYIDEAKWLKQEYDLKLGNLMDHYGIKSEAEIVSGCILNMSVNFTKKKDANAIRLAMKSLRKETRSWFSEGNNKAFNPHDFRQDYFDDYDAKASAWYHVTYHPEYFGYYNKELQWPHFISFPWCVYDKLLRIKRRKRSLRRIKHSMLPL